MTLPRKLWLMFMLPGLPLMAGGGLDAVPAAKPPAYKALRFDEDYSHLAKADRQRAGDLFDTVNYIPLMTGNPAWYLSIGGEVRERFEGAANPGFGLRGDYNTYWLQRLVFSTDWHLGDRARVYAAGISGLAQGGSLSAPPTQDDPVDLLFAFAEFTPWRGADGESVVLRVGRFGMSLGAGRLVATRASPNIPLRFDGFEALFNSRDWQATLFLTKPVTERTNGFDNYDDHITFWGAYVTRWFDATRKNGVD
ncbi:MAG: alginate export family protein, partial [Verrucomicrobiales bacterium]|nr:alginate export family protein [Verrucomicrobiales bacterium]